MVIARVCFLAFYLTILFNVTENKVAKVNIKDAQTIIALNTMLNNLVKLNEERVKLLKKYTVLKDPSKFHLASKQARHRSEKESAILGILMLENQNPKTAGAKGPSDRYILDENYNENKYDFNDDGDDEYENNEEAFYKTDLRHTNLAIIDVEKKIFDANHHNDYDGIEHFTPKKETDNEYFVDSNNITKEYNIAMGKNVAIENNVAKDNVVTDEPLHDNKTGSIKNILRMWKKCSREALKLCKKACKQAFKEVCKDYMCSRTLKKALKKQCNKNCKSNFND